MTERDKGKHPAAHTGKAEIDPLVKRKMMPAGKKTAIVIAIILTVLAVIAIAGYAVFHHYYNLMDHGMDIGDPEDDYWEDPIDSDGVAGPDDNDIDLPPSTEDEIDAIDEQILENLEKQEESSELYDTDAFNIMILGVDSRKDSFSGRSDAMILLSIDKTTKKVVMSSFLRDIYCSIPGRTNNRLNTAYNFGGMDLHKEAMKANFGITVDRCVVVNFYFVMDAVDAVGGIDLDLTADEIRVMNNIIRGHNSLLGQDANTDILPQQDSTVHVNGNQALAYCRVRYVGTDFARTGRQRTVIMKCLEKVKGMSIGELMDLAEQFLPKIRTDLTESDCAALLLTLLGISDYDIETMRIPVDGTWKYASIRGMSVITIDFEENSKAWHDAVEGTSADGEN